MTAVFDKATSRHMLGGFFPSSFCCTACILYMYLYLGASRRISSASKDFLRMQVCFSLRYVFFHARLHCKKILLPDFQVQNTKFVDAHFISSAGLVKRRWCSKIRQPTHPTGLLLAIHSHHASKTAYPRNVYSSMRV